MDRAEQLLERYREVLGEIAEHARSLAGDERREFGDRLSREPHPTQVIG